MTDGDNVQWLLNTFASPAADWYGSKQRGKVKLGWTVAPAMAELAPAVLQYLYSLSDGKDNFVAGPSGVGYTVTDNFQSASKFAVFDNLTQAMCRKADLRVVNVIQDSDDVSRAATMLDHQQIDGVIAYYGDSYCGAKGRIWWHHGKPVVGGRAALWEDHLGVVGLARLLRTLPKDPRNPDSYSVVPVHVWSHNVSDVVQTAAWLGEQGFDLVTPEELISQLTSNVFNDCTKAQAATGSFSKSCKGCQDACGVLTRCSCTTGDAGSVASIDFFDHSVCSGSEVSNCFGRLQCASQPCSKQQCPPAPSGSYLSSCKNCVNACGLLTGCVCSGGASDFTNDLSTSVAQEGRSVTEEDAGFNRFRNEFAATSRAAQGTVLPSFDYTSCPSLAVANCMGALVCQGDPCS